MAGSLQNPLEQPLLALPFSRNLYTNVPQAYFCTANPLTWFSLGQRKVGVDSEKGGWGSWGPARTSFSRWPAREASGLQTNFAMQPSRPRWSAFRPLVSECNSSEGEGEPFLPTTHSARSQEMPHLQLGGVYPFRGRFCGFVSSPAPFSGSHAH